MFSFYNRVVDCREEPPPEYPNDDAGERRFMAARGRPDAGPKRHIW